MNQYNPNLKNCNHLFHSARQGKFLRTWIPLQKQISHRPHISQSVQDILESNLCHLDFYAPVHYPIQHAFCKFDIGKEVLPFERLLVARKNGGLPSPFRSAGPGHGITRLAHVYRTCHSINLVNYEAMHIRKRRDVFCPLYSFLFSY